MKYYRRKRYSDKKARRIFLRILFVIAAAVLITFLTVLLGLHVKEKVEEAENKINGAETVQINSETPPLSGYLDSEKLLSQKEIAGIGFDPMAEGALDPVPDAVKEHFDTVSVKITEEGRLIYPSPAMLAFAKVPAEDAVWFRAEESCARIKEFCSLRKAEGFRVSAVLEASVADGVWAWENDRILLKELAEMGFEEVIIAGLGDLSSDKIQCLFRLNDMELEIGVVFPAEEYLVSENESLIRTAFLSGIRLCADFDGDTVPLEETEQRIKTLCSKFRSMMEGYSIRSFISSSDEQFVAAEYGTLMALDVGSIMIKEPVDLPLLLSVLPQTEETEEETLSFEETESPLNPYIVTTPEESETESADVDWY